MIEVRLFATFRYGRDKIYHLEANEHKTAQSILDYFDIPTEDVAILLINGKHRAPEDTVENGDIVALFPPVGGG